MVEETFSEDKNIVKKDDDFSFSFNINSIFHVPMEKTDFVNWKSFFFIYIVYL